MPFNGSGVFQRVRNWVADATAGIKIRADYHDAEDDGFAAGLTNCITKDGQTVIVQNIPFNSKRITGLEDPVNPQDASTKAYADTKLAKTGEKMTGDLEIEKPSPTIILDDTTPVGETSSGAGIQGQRVSKMRWLLRVGTGAPETGANAGSDFDINRYADDGAHLGTPLHFRRATGLGIVSGDPIEAMGIATKGYTDTKDAALQASINTKQASLGFTPVQQSGGAFQTASKVYIGWDGAGLRAQVDATDLGRFTMGTGIIGVRLAFAGDWQMPYNNATIEPFSGAVATGAHGVTNAGPTYVFTRLRMRYLQTTTDNVTWYTVGYTA